MLTDAVVEDGGVSRFLKPRAAGADDRRLGSSSGSCRARRGWSRRGACACRGRALGAAPAKGDRRFGDRGWHDNWLLRRVLQGYLATCDTVDHLISDADLDWRTERQARFAASNVLDALAPSNFPWSIRPC